MSDTEVARLRRLRGSALRVRSIARALGSARWASNDTLMSRGACTSWRLARMVTGHLRAHPYVRYQKDAGFGCRVCNRVLAGFLAVSSRNRTRALMEYEARLRRLLRQLDDARALTWTPHLSDSFGRSQLEIKSLLAALADETNGVQESSRAPKRGPSITASRAEDFGAPIQGDWPYLAF
jgi:hypothetical protein